MANLQSFPEANFPDKFLMKSSGLLNTFAPSFSEAAGETRTRLVEGNMSLTVFMALKEAWCSAQRRHMETA